MAAAISDIVFLSIVFKEIKIKTSLSAYILFYSLQTIFSSVLTFIFNTYIASYALNFIGMLTGTLIVSSCLVIVGIKPDIISNILIVPRWVKRICIASIFSSAMIISLLLFGNSVSNLMEWNSHAKLFLVAFIVIIGSVFPAIIASSVGKVYYARQAKEFERQIELQAEHYEEIAKNNLELRRFRHDYKNMLIGVTELIQDGDSQGAIELLQRESGAYLSSPSQRFETGNGIVDAILLEKQKRAETVNTVIEFDGAVPTEKIAPTDLCVIFGNTLDNAIEACQGVEQNDQNVISVSCRSAGGFVFVNIKNPVKENVSISHNVIKTSKKNKSEHGFGLYSLKKAAKKYNGTMKLSCENNIFSVDLELEVTV